VGVGWGYILTTTLNRICKKTELKEDATRRIIERAIDAEHDRVRQSEDATPDWNSDNDTSSGSPTTPFVPLDDELCDGYHDNNGERKCLGPCSGYLYFTNHDGTTFHFCKASHMMRYIVKHHTGKRGNAGAKRRRSGN
jgi:hypothetical protein